MFDLSIAEGVNESERLLMRLCRKSFLSLWAHANLHTAQDMREGTGSAKEFTDVLVAFGDDVIIFSDKHIAFQEDKDLKIAWPRWFKRAVTESAKQLHGAMSWLRRCPDLETRGIMAHVEARGFDSAGGLYRHLLALIDYANMVDQPYAQKQHLRLKQRPWNSVAQV